MKVSDVTIFIVTETVSTRSESLWYNRWQKQLSKNTEIKKIFLDFKNVDAWFKKFIRVLQSQAKPIVFIGYSLGVAAIVKASSFLPESIKGAFLVAPIDFNLPSNLSILGKSFMPYPRTPLRFPSVVIGSETDPFSSLKYTESLAGSWNSLFLNAGDCGHIDLKSGHGPWPEGCMVFAKFISHIV